MRQPLVNINICKQRRDLLRDLLLKDLLLKDSPKENLGDKALILASPLESTGPIGGSYRQDSHMLFLTGFEEPDSIFIFRPGKEPESILFVRPKDPLRETWNGYRFGTEGATAYFGMDKAHSIEEFSEVAPHLLKEMGDIYYGLGNNNIVDPLVISALKKVKQLKGRKGVGIQTLVDPHPLLGEMRLKKDEYSLPLIKRATEITCEAHVEVMKSVAPGKTERAMHGIFVKEIMWRGAAREGYHAIMASGNNGTTLHYIFNDQVMKSGDLFLVDAGAEYGFFTGDVTRTYPINGQFTDVQKRLYEKILNVQKSMIALVKPGFVVEDLQAKAIEKLVEVMLSEKLLTGSAEEIISSKEYKKYYPHGIGHWLGMDVHDAGPYQVQGESRPLEPGMCLTIEPGLYIPAHDTSAPEALRGIGIRIEDNILVTEGGSINMTEKCPKEVEDLESIVGSASVPHFPHELQGVREGCEKNSVV